MMSVVSITRSRIVCCKHAQQRSELLSFHKCLSMLAAFESSARLADGFDGDAELAEYVCELLHECGGHLGYITRGRDH